MELSNNNHLPIFERIKMIRTDGSEYWSARILQQALGYSSWPDFLNVISKAKTAARISGQSDDAIKLAFRQVLKRYKTSNRFGEFSDTKIDLELSRFACYLIAQNGNSSKPEVALAQSYFAIQTRKQELSKELKEQHRRVEARKKLSETEKKFQGIMYDRNVDSIGIATVRNRGDQVLFGGNSTPTMKHKLGIKHEKKPLADVLPTVTLKAKDLAAEMSSVNIVSKRLRGVQAISTEHVNNNSVVRSALLNRGIKPEQLPAEEDIKVVERRLMRRDRELLLPAEKPLKLNTNFRDSIRLIVQV